MKATRIVLVACWVLILTAVLLGNVRNVYAYEDTKGHWAEQTIDLITSRQLVNGYPDGNFRPDQPVTRAEMARIMVGVMGMEDLLSQLEDVPSFYADVSSDHWAKAAIELMREAGVVQGYPPGIFRPDQPVTREEALIILARTLNGIEVENEEKLPFIDRDAISPWAVEGIKQLVSLEIVKGYPDGTLRPQEKASRAEVLALVERLLGIKGDRYEFSGTLLEVKQPSRAMEIELNGEALTFSYKPDLPVYSGDHRISVTELAYELPRRILFNLNRSGGISYLETADTFTDNVQLTVTRRYNPYREVQEHIKQHMTYLSAPRVNLEKNPELSLETTKKEMKVPQMVSRTGANGEGVIIAVVDTGVDPLHPDLQQTVSGEKKIIQWVDFTREGWVNTERSLVAGKDKYYIDGQEFHVGFIPSAGGIYHYGFFKEMDIHRDVNFDQDLNEKFLVLITDPNSKGVYEAVYIDTDGDGFLGEENALKPYGQEFQKAAFKGETDDRQFSFVVTELSSNGTGVNLGFDANGHGTHVAGIAAANGRLKGVAPGAKIMVVKAIQSNGEADWSILKGALEYAAAHGADIINLSLGFYQDVTAGNNSLAQLVNRLSEEHGVLFTVASGNRGPGLGSVATPANADKAISVGAYVSPRMWLNDFGWEVERESLWFFSSVGPRKDGELVPTVVAPGSAVSTAPLWLPHSYYLAEGTSMAAPHAAGVAALLLDAAGREQKTVTPEMIKKAVAAGAKKIEGLSEVEAGFGVIDALAAWERLEEMAGENAGVKARTYNLLYGSGQGLYAREFLPGQINYWIEGTETAALRLRWRSTAQWMAPLLKETAVAGGGGRTLPVKFELPEQPGLYTGLLQGDVPETPGIDLQLLNTVVRPYEFTAGNNFRWEFSDSLGAAQYRRYFFRVPPGTERLSSRLEVPRDKQGRYQGRARIHLVTPGGEEVGMTDYAGFGPEDTVIRGQVSATVEDPRPGVWEVVVYSSATLSLYEARESRYTLEVTIDGSAGPEKEELEAIPYIFGVVHQQVIPDRVNYITLHVRDKEGKKPVEGEIEINGRLYSINGGRVTFPAKAENGFLKISVGL
ncbi:S8 family serine peptidase [Calderihabitans maritimus]|uniref:S8 family serine peptidase n=1 Tax=Calderihabitans maritimus TaxID=1246530 RepID=UPI00117797B0|nr:S8 family serine peptidase [Calderihabitans maritimus]